MVAILNSAILDSTILHKKNFTYLFWLNLMMAAILNSTIMNSAILDSTIFIKLWLKLIQSDSNSFILSQLDDGSHLEFCHLGFSHYAQNSDSNVFNLTQTHSFSPNLMMAAILNSANLNSTILDSAILVFPLKLTHTCQDWFPPFAQKYFTHSFWLNLMMAAILKSDMLNSDTAILDSDTLLSSLRFTQKHSHFTLILN